LPNRLTLKGFERTAIRGWFNLATEKPVTFTAT